MATFRLEGLTLFGHHGATRAERWAGTRLDVDVELDIDTKKAESSDRLADTVSYDRIEAAVRQVVEKNSFRLLETLAARVAETCVDRFAARHVSVRLSKSTLAWPTGGRITVEVRREGKARKR